MALPAPIQAIYDRLASFYNGNAYDPSSNPGGFARGGNQRGVFIAAMRDFAAFGKVVAEAGQAVPAAAADAAESAEAAAASAQTASDSADRAAQFDPSTYAPKASPVFTGNPTAPTPASGDRDASLATTEFVGRADDDLRREAFAYSLAF